MNFDHMPELGWLLGYPVARGLMLATNVVLYLLFEPRDWI
jgi:magnesium transporter